MLANGFEPLKSFPRPLKLHWVQKSVKRFWFMWDWVYFQSRLLEALLSHYPGIPDSTCRLSPPGLKSASNSACCTVYLPYFSASQSIQWVPNTHILVYQPHNCQLAKCIILKHVILCIISNRWFSVWIWIWVFLAQISILHKLWLQQDQYVINSAFSTSKQGVE